MHAKSLMIHTARRAAAFALALWPAAVLAASLAAGDDPGSQLVMQALNAQAPAYVAPQFEHLLGDLGGIRPYLENRGIYVQLDATAEFAGNTGGTKQGATSANQVALSIDIDWQRLAGVTGLSTHVIFVNRSGANDSHLFGDNVAPAQEIYGAGGDVAVHLVSAYAEETMFGGRLDLAAGWMNVENDFASSPLYCNYMNNVLCGDPKALPGGDIGHSAFPDAVWGGRIRVRPEPNIYAEVGVYEVNQDLYSQADRSGFEFGVPRDSGVYVPIQLGYEPNLGPDLLPGHYVIGFGYDSSRFKSFADALPAPIGSPQSSHKGNTQFWLLVDQMLVRNGVGAQNGLIALGGFVHNDPDNSPYAEEYFAGLLDRGFWRARPDDAVGVLFSYVTMSGALGKVQAEESELGLPISNAATGIQTHEMILEADYNIHVFRGVDFRPDFQYIFRPNAQDSIHNAAVFGFKAHVQF
jgi:porin